MKRRRYLRDPQFQIYSGYRALSICHLQTWICWVGLRSISPIRILQPNRLTLRSVGGPDRPPSKRTAEQMRADEQERRRAARGGRSAPESAAKGEQEGYWSYMQRQVQERTQQLGLTGDSMDRLEENSGEWANDVSKYVSTQKRKAVFGCEL
jgi:hypothetical protein